jgi:hypothetical protein
MHICYVVIVIKFIIITEIFLKKYTYNISFAIIEIKKILAYLVVAVVRFLNELTIELVK